MKVTLEAIYSTVLKIDKKLDPLPDRVTDHEHRIRSLEQKVWLWVGAAAAGGGGIWALLSRALV